MAKESNSSGRPVEYTEEVLEKIAADIDKYTDETDIPIVAEFAYNYNIRKATLYEHKRLSYSIKRMMEKKEFQLEKKAMDGDVNSTFAIFSLKQMGWSDKQELQHTTIDEAGEPTGFILEFVKAK
ncbi:MAG: hypothetical protein JRJ00_00125 [Deltaproteobacteria bacterium]|nr:hypothetical protein [Deltaproteobacteria bacterium]